MDDQLDQTAQREMFDRLGDGPWTVVHDSLRTEDVNLGVHCALSDPSRRERALSDPGWDLRVGEGSPGFSQSWTDGETVTTYHSSTASEGLEPLVLVREYYGAAESTIEIDQQFRLFHNLRHDPTTNSYYKMQDDGTADLAIKVEGDRVTVRTPLLKQYIAARQLDLLLFVDSVVWSDEKVEMAEVQEFQTNELVGFLAYQDEAVFSGRAFTRFLATKVVQPGPIETCGIWPFEPEDDNYPEFVIGEDEHGKPVSFTCDPDLLANYFGANPDAPHYLTPVHFRREVLQKYYNKPELYSVEDGYLTCVGLWGLQLDNDHEDRVVVFLGDLGRDLPSSERDYWRGFMVPPDSKISETSFRRAFLAQPTNPGAVDLRFRTRYSKTNKAWVATYGWPLFREPKEADVYLLQQVRLPLNDTQNEFEDAIKLLAKLMSDALNEKEIGKALTEKVPDEKGISKLERFLTEAGYPHVERDIAFLRTVQELRSRVTAHLKGSDYEAMLNKNLGDRRGVDAVRWLLERGIAMLQGLTAWVAPQESGDDAEVVRAPNQE